MARSLKDIAERLGDDDVIRDNFEDYTNEYKNIIANLNGKLVSWY